MPKTLWIDVEDLFDFAAHHSRPTGIQRLAVEFYRVFDERLGKRNQVRFVRLNVEQNSFNIVPSWSVFELFDHASRDAFEKPVPLETPVVHQRSLLRRILRPARLLFPPSIRPKIVEIIRLQLAVLRAIAALIVQICKAILRRLIGDARDEPAHEAPRPETDRGSCEEFMTAVRPGDIVIAMGAYWPYQTYAEIIETNKARHGIEFAFLSYDIIPITCPEWCDPNLTRVFTDWVRSILPVTDHIFAISRYSASDLSKFAARSGTTLRSEPHVVTIGNGFTFVPSPDPVVRADLPEPGTYVLFVSTIEPRKNQSLLFRVWRRLLTDRDPSQVPTLVFAGRVGWQIADLMSQLRNTDCLNGKIAVLEGMSDHELRQLYDGCLFTIYPSLYEGWGLPVTESLAFGKPCLASNKTSLPEAGGQFARYFDPDNGNEAYEAIQALLDDRDGLRQWEQQIRRDFRPTSWADAATTMLTALGVDEPHVEATRNVTPQQTVA